MMRAIDIAKQCGRKHCHVMAAVRRICAQKGIDPYQFGEFYRDDKGAQRITYVIPDEMGNRIIATHNHYKMVRG